jgi:ABC-type phosphate transport system auxiliary subunit
VAVLLQQFHLGSSGKAVSNGESATSAAPPPEPQAEAAPSLNEPAATVDLNFREATLFIDWIQQAVGNLGKEPSLAPVPKSLGGVAREWAGVIDRLNQQFLESEEDRTDAQRNLQSAEKIVDSLTKELEAAKSESDAAQKVCTGLEKKVKQLEESLVDFSRISKERDRLVSKVSTMQSELQNKGAELESVSMTLKSLSNAIRNLLPSDPL